MTALIANLAPTETISFNQKKLVDLCNAQGARAENTITLTLTEIETLIAGLPDAGTDRVALKRACRDLRYLADTIGMATVARASHGVIDCIDRGNDAALAPCLARLRRLGAPSGTHVLTMTGGAQPETVA